MRFSADGMLLTTLKLKLRNDFKRMTRSFYSILFLFSVGFILIFSSCEREEAPFIPKNRKPIIEKIIASNKNVIVNGKTQLTITAIDPDSDFLKFSWSSKRGQFSNAIKNSATWNAPSTSGTDTIFVTVTDGKEFVIGSIIIMVGKPPLTPTALNPKNDSSEVPLSPSLNWKSDKTVTDYTLQVSADPDFKHLTINKSGIKTSRKILSGIKINTVYYWRVKSRNLFGSSGWSKISKFTTVAPPVTPTLVTPIDSTKDVALDIELKWHQLRNAEQYSIQIATDESFTEIIFSQENIRDSYAAAGGLKVFSNYYWRVKAQNNYGESDWSNAWYFSTVGTAPVTPSLAFPSDRSTNITLDTKLIWTEIEHAKNYVIQVAKDSLFSSTIMTEDSLTKPNFELKGLNYFTKYFWRVASSNEYGKSVWSQTNSFITKIESPTAITLDEENIDLPMSPKLFWKEVKGAESYTLQVSDDENFSNFLIADSTITSTNKRITGLSDYTTYYWRVAANNPNGNSDWSNVQSYKATGYFYQGLPYGSQSLYNPAYVILTGGFGMIQFGNQRDVKNFPFNIAFKNIWNNFKDPFTPISHYGWWNFFKDQVFPLSLNKKSAQFWPNYSLHLIGGGMEYAATREWYKYYNYPHPEWLSAFTIMSYHLINEVVENGNRVGEDVDPIADFYLFDIGGIILFSSESVKRFFAEDLNLADWSQQSSFSIKNGELHNNDQFFSVKWKFPFSDSWHAFYFFGTNGVGGLSYKYKDGSAISFGVGLAASDLIVLDEKTNKKTLGLVGNFAAFYDKNNSLLASLSVTMKTDYMINLNIYPGVIKLWGISPGLWGAYSQNGKIILGITAMWAPFGLAYSTK